MNAEQQNFTIRDYHAALRLAGVDRDNVRDCSQTFWGWVVTLYAYRGAKMVQYKLTPDGQMSAN